MGIASSTEFYNSSYNLTEPVTIGRIRQACQKNSKLPEKVRKFQTQLLANDLNKLGFNIPIKGKEGGEASINEMCNRITKAVPNVSDVCMINSENRGNTDEALKKIVEHFNDHYGSNILFYKNQFGPENKENMRDVESICDDLYMVEDRVRRNLEDDTTMTKKKLLEGINQLQTYKKVLNDDFNVLFSRLKSNNQLDIVQKNMQDASKLKEIMLGEMEKQTKTAQNAYDTIITMHKNKIHPLLGVAEINLDRYAGVPFGSYKGLNPLQSFEKNKLQPLFVGLAALDAAANECIECESRFDDIIANYNAGDKSDQAKQEYIANLYTKAKNLQAAAGSIPEAMRIQACLTKLIRNPNYSESCKKIKNQKAAKQQSMANNMAPSSGIDVGINSVYSGLPSYYDMPFSVSMPFGEGELKFEKIKERLGLPYIDVNDTVNQYGPTLGHFVGNSVVGGKRRRKSAKSKKARKPRRKSTKGKKSRRKSAKC